MRTAFLLLLLSLVFLGASSLLKAQTPAVTHNTWTSGAPLPIALNWPMTGVVKNLTYVVGGYVGSTVLTDNQIYNPATNSWSGSR